MGIIQTIARYIAPGSRLATRAEGPPKNPYLAYGGYGGSGYSTSHEYYSNSFSGWSAAAQYNVWAKNCINARKSFVSKANLCLWRGEGDEKEQILDHPVLDVLRDVNSLNANRKSFKRQIEGQLCVYGRCVILKVGGASVRELYILARPLIEVLPDPANWIAGYRWIPTGQVYAPDEIIDLYYQADDGTPAEVSPTATAMGAINKYALADISQAAIDKRGGQGGGIVFYPDNMQPDEFERTKTAWENIRSNPNNAGRDVHVSNALKYESGALSAHDMQREERSGRLMTEIFAAYQVPPAIAGDYTDASVLANASVQEKLFAEGWGVEELEFIEETFNNQLLWPGWPETRDGGLYLAHNLADIPALREDEQEKAGIVTTKAQTATIAVAGSIWSINEGRRYTGLDTISDPRADSVMMVDQAAPAAAAEESPAPAAAKADAARKLIANYVGIQVRTPAGVGPIEKVAHFGQHFGRQATKAAPLFVVAGAAYLADELEVLE